MDWIYSDTRDQPLFSSDIPSINNHTPLDLSNAGGRTLPVHAASTSNLAKVPALSDDTKDSGKAQRPELNESDKRDDDGSVPVAKMRDMLNSNVVSKSQRRSEDTETLPAFPKSSRKRWTWLRSDRSEASLKIRDSVIIDPESKASKKSAAKTPRRLKVVFMGDGASGKTCLLLSVY